MLTVFPIVYIKEELYAFNKYIFFTSMSQINLYPIKYFFCQAVTIVKSKIQSPTWAPQASSLSSVMVHGSFDLRMILCNEHCPAHWGDLLAFSWSRATMRSFTSSWGYRQAFDVTPRTIVPLTVQYSFRIVPRWQLWAQVQCNLYCFQFSPGVLLTGPSPPQTVWCERYHSHPHSWELK